MRLNDITTRETFAEAEQESRVIREMISIVPCKQLQKELTGLLGCPVDKMAEYIIAALMDFKVTNKHGSDFVRGNKKGEGKWSTVSIKPKTSTYVNKNNVKTVSVTPTKCASISNLKTKDCDLYVLMRDPLNRKEYFTLFRIPRNVWKSKWKGNSAEIILGQKGSHWALDYKIQTWSM